jgi:thiamine pyrophosphate-dependent acetolactate synthase large subunit-like protein
MAHTTVADVLVDGLVRAGAARVFVAPGANITLVAAVQRRSLVVVEAPDAMAAVVLAAVSGEIGEGPGAAIASLDDPRGVVGGLARAQRDRAPVIVLTDGGADASLLVPVVKASVRVEPASAGHWIAHAAQLAMKDPRGPVHLLVGADVTAAPSLPVAASCRPGPLPPPAPADLDAFGEALAAVERPLVVTGLECRAEDARWIRSFAETLPAPVLATTKGRGALAEPHPLALGMLTAGHAALARCDLVILVGVDVDELPPGILPAHAQVARIGRAPWPGGGFVAEVLGDLALAIEELAPAVRARATADWDVAELDRIKRGVTRSAAASPAAQLVALAREATPADTVATSDLAALIGWQAVAPRETLTPLDRATPGYAVLAALAAQLAHAGRRVVAFTNASGLAAGVTALARATALVLPIVVVVLGELDRETMARLEGDSLRPLTARDEHDFPRAFARAFMAGRPAVVAVQARAMT